MSTTIILIFALFGILDTIYISYHAYKNTDVWCPLFPNEWCTKVQYSSWSKIIFGIPNAYLGLVLYLMIFISTGLNFLEILSIPFLIIQILSAMGFAFAFFFTIIQAFVLKAWCIWCVISAINLSAIFIAVFFL